MFNKELVMTLNHVEAVKEFVQLNSQFEGTADIIRGKYHLPGTTIMSIFAMDASEPFTVTVEADSEEKIADLIKGYQALATKYGADVVVLE